MQEEVAVSAANCAFSFCASRAFWSWNEDADEVAVAVAAADVVAAAVVVAATSVEVALALTVESSQSESESSSLELSSSEESLEESADPPSAAMFCRPGSWVTSVSCVPSAMGPAVLAGHEPRTARGALCPKGMVPAAPSASPPTNVFWLAPSNWHWKSPSSSAFLGALWQYGTACELGWGPREGQGQRARTGARERRGNALCCAAAARRSVRT